MRTLTVLMVVVATFLPGVVMAQARPQPTIPATTSRTTGSPADEAAILRAQLETMQRSDDRLIQTVHWSLGVVVAIALGLAGYSGWFNYRIYKRDVAALRATLEANVQTETQKVRAAMQAEHNAHVDAVKKIVTDTITLAIAATRKELETRIEEVRRKLLYLERDVVLAEGERNEQEGVLFNAANSYCQAIGIAKALGHTKFYDIPLERLLEVLKKVPKGKASALASPGNISDIASTIAMLPKQYSATVQAIQKLLDDFSTA